MPRNTDGANARGGAVRSILSSLRKGDVVLMFPEGQNSLDFEMRCLQPGVGHFLRMLSTLRVPVVPAGFAEITSVPMIQFGHACQIDPASSDGETEMLVGKCIANLLPPLLRGPFG